MKAYIAGKITNNDNYKHEFQVAQTDLILDGYTVMNPAVLNKGLNKWSIYTYVKQ